MGRKKKRGRRAGSALSPINKKGVKIGTLVAEMGIATNVAQSWNSIKTGKAAGFYELGQSFVDFNRPGTKLMWTGIAIALAGRMAGVRSIGPIQFS